MEDQKIIDLIRESKHDKAFVKLYTYLPVVRKMIIANSGKPEDAEDIYQEALIIFYRKAKEPDFILTASINTYLYSVSSLMWKNHLKQNRKFVFVDTEKEVVDEAEIISEIEKENRFKLAEKVVSELGERCKELLTLFYFNSKKLKDIAVKMGYNSENTAKNQKYKCLEAAKLKLKALK